MNEAALIAQLSSGIEAELEELHRPRLGARVLELGVLLAALVTGFWLSLGDPLWSRAIGALLVVLGLNAGVLFVHEGMHRVLFPHAGLNRVVSVLLGGSVLMSFSAYRVLHILHHDNLGGDDDPDDYHNYTGSRWRVWILHYTRVFFGSLLYLFLIPLLALKKGTARDRRMVLSEYALLALAWWALGTAVGWGLLARVWLLPLVFVGWLVNLRGLTQHGLTDPTDPLLASRSVDTNRLVSLLLLHENLHLEHHLFPQVPSYHLPRLRELLADRLPRKLYAPSYAGFLWRFLRRTPRLDETPVGLTPPAPTSEMHHASP